MSPVVLVLVALTSDPAPAVPEKPKPRTAEEIVLALKQPSGFDGDVDETPVLELFDKLTRRHGVPFVILDEYFKAAGVPDFKDKKPTVIATGLKDMPLRQFLSLVLEGVNATYLVKSGRIEVIPLGVERDAARGLRHTTDGTAVPPPLVSVIVKQKPLKEVVDALADEYDLGVVVSAKVGDALNQAVTARLLNVPAGQALDRLAVAADLRVVSHGGTFLITTPEHAKELAAERVERARQQVEMQRLRAFPFVFPPNLPGIGP